MLHRVLLAICLAIALLTSRSSGQEVSLMTGPDADPKVDAAHAVAAGDFRLMVAGQYGSYPLGVLCFTPGGRPNGVREGYHHGDYITPDVAAARAYIRAYNIAVVSSPAYADADICRVAQEGDPPVDRGMPLVARAARPVSDPVRSLHEAARRGSAGDVRRFLDAASLNAPDGTGMTPLAWAVARDNRGAVAVLLEHGADPWAGEKNYDHSAVYWAAATGRLALFDRFRGADRPAALTPWPQDYLAGAVDSGNAAIVTRMLADGHAPLTGSIFFRRGLPSAEAIAPLLTQRSPGLAETLLFASLEPWGADPIPLPLVKLALANGASPDAKRAYGETALGMASRGFWDGSFETVELLLTAGADVDLPSAAVPVAPQRPFWEAVRTVLRTGKKDVTTERAWRIALRLAAAGANLDLPDKDGRPAVWSLLTPVRYDPESINGSPTLPELVPMLVKLGMDPNAKWQGKTVLPLVERKLGMDSALAVALRGSGAR